MSADGPSTTRPSALLSVVADALREWQRNHGGESDYAPTTMFIDKAEQPAQAVLDALTEAGYGVWHTIQDRDGICRACGCEETAPNVCPWCDGDEQPAQSDPYRDVPS